jgi:hypothetical protein
LIAGNIMCGQRMLLDPGKEGVEPLHEGALGVFLYKIEYIERCDAARDGIVMWWAIL